MGRAHEERVEKLMEMGKIELPDRDQIKKEAKMELLRDLISAFDRRFPGESIENVLRKVLVNVSKS